MAIKRLQNRIAESRIALPFTALLVIPAWIGTGVLRDDVLPQFALTVVASYVMVELNNVNALIRIYSRMVSCSFLMLCAITAALYASVESCTVELCTAAAYLILFHAYQDKRSPGITYFAFLSLGVASMMFVQILYFVPFLWLLMATNLMMMSSRNFVASILGLITPYWFAGLYYLYEGNLTTPLQHFAELGQFGSLSQYLSIDSHQVATTIFIVIVAVTGIVHFLRTSYNDKIRTRMLFESFITMDIIAMLFLILQPQHYKELTAIIIVNTSPLIGHYIALTRTFITDLSFKLMIIIAIALTAYNIWIPHSIF